LKKIKLIFLTVIILLVVGCVATAIAYPFIGKTTPSIEEPDPDPDPDPNPNPEPQPEPDPEPEPEPEPAFEPIPRPQYVRGLFLTGHGAGSKKLREPVIKLLRESELNSLVINVKDDYGYITHGRSEIPMVIEAKANQKQFDLDSFMQQLREEQIYPIARIVVAKDKHVCKVMPQWFLQKADGTVWKDKNDTAWADLRNEEYWDYLLDIAEEAASMGFREIQFDYIRWPSGGDGKVSNIANLPAANMTSTGPYERSEIIAKFLKYAKERLAPLGIDVSADTFGIMGTVKDEQTVGQQLEVMLTTDIHAISPMIYPSHYWTGTYGYKVPDQEPYGVAYQSSKDHLVRMEAVNSKIIMRPWLQDFTATWVKGYIRYGVKEIHAQLRAMQELGIKEYLFWNAGNKYTEEAFRTWNSE
jgi:hypothetical protein